MKKLFLMIITVCAITTTAQEIEQVDTICLDTIDFVCPLIPQIPLDEIDSLGMSRPYGRYVVAYKGGRCGIYDMMRGENVTRIEYAPLSFYFREKKDGEYYTFFSWDDVNSQGVLGISEGNNRFITISIPKKKEDENN